MQPSGVIGATRSDALVLFGATGDLAYKKIFPALQALVRRGDLEMPVIGIARGGGSLDTLRARVRDSLEQTAASMRTHSRDCRRGSSYVDGDYRDPATYERLRTRAGCVGASAALPRHSAEHVRAPWCRAWRRRAAPRMRASSSRSRSAATSRRRRSSTRRCTTCSRSVDLPHRPLPGQGGGAEPPVLPLRQRVPRADLEPQLRRQRADHHGRELRRAGRGGVLRGGRRHPRRGPEPPAAGRRAAGDGAPPASDSGADARARSCACSARCGRSSRRDVVRGQYRGYRDEPGVAPDSDVETFAALRLHIDTWRWAGVPFYIRAGKCLPITATEVHRRPEAPAAGDVRRLAPATTANYLRFRLSPDVVDRAGARVKRPGEDMRGEPRRARSRAISRRARSRRTSGCSATRCAAMRRCSRARTPSRRLGASSIRCSIRNRRPARIRARHLGTRDGGRRADRRRRRLARPGARASPPC